MVANGELDFAIVTSDKSNADLIQEDLMQDQIYLCVKDSLLREYYGDEAEDIKMRSLQGASVSDFARLPFCIFANNMGQRIHVCFEEANVTPKIRLNTTYTQVCTTVGFQGLVAFFASQVNLTHRQSEIPPDMNIFPLLCHGEPMYLHLSLLRHKQRYLTHYSKYFLELLSAFCSAAEQAPVSRITNGTKG